MGQDAASVGQSCRVNQAADNKVTAGWKGMQNTLGIWTKKILLQTNCFGVLLASVIGATAGN
jgi:hypothetical protein